MANIIWYSLDINSVDQNYCERKPNNVFILNNSNISPTFISIDEGSASANVGIKIGDQILSVNGHDFQDIYHKRAVAILRSYRNYIMIIHSIGKLPLYREVYRFLPRVQIPKRANAHHESTLEPLPFSDGNYLDIGIVNRAYTESMDSLNHSMNIPEFNVNNLSLDNKDETRNFKKSFETISLQSNGFRHKNTDFQNNQALKDQTILPKSLSQNLKRTKGVVSNLNVIDSATDGRKLTHFSMMPNYFTTSDKLYSQLYGLSKSEQPFLMSKGANNLSIFHQDSHTVDKKFQTFSDKNNSVLTSNLDGEGCGIIKPFGSLPLLDEVHDIISSKELLLESKRTLSLNEMYFPIAVPYSELNLTQNSSDTTTRFGKKTLLALSSESGLNSNFYQADNEYGEEDVFATSSMTKGKNNTNCVVNNQNLAKRSYILNNGHNQSIINHSGKYGSKVGSIVAQFETDLVFKPKTASNNYVTKSMGITIMTQTPKISEKFSSATKISDFRILSSETISQSTQKIVYQEVKNNKTPPLIINKNSNKPCQKDSFERDDNYCNEYSKEMHDASLTRLKDKLDRLSKERDKQMMYSSFMNPNFIETSHDEPIYANSEVLIKNFDNGQMANENYEGNEYATSTNERPNSARIIRI